MDELLAIFDNVFDGESYYNYKLQEAVKNIASRFGAKSAKPSSTKPQSAWDEIETTRDEQLEQRRRERADNDYVPTPSSQANESKSSQINDSILESVWNNKSALNKAIDIYPPRVVLNTINRHRQTIEDESKRYGIPTAILKTLLLKEGTSIDASDAFADALAGKVLANEVMLDHTILGSLPIAQNIERNALNALAAISDLAGSRVVNNYAMNLAEGNSSVGIAQMQVNNAIRVLNKYDNADLPVDDAKTKLAIIYALEVDIDFNIHAMSLLLEDIRMTHFEGKDFSDFSVKDFNALMGYYNGSSVYGDEAEEQYLLFTELEKAEDDKRGK